MKPGTFILSLMLFFIGAVLLALGELQRSASIATAGGFVMFTSIAYLLLTLITIVPGKSVYRLESSLRKGFTRLVYPGVRLLSPSEYVSGSINLRFFGMTGGLDDALSAEGVPHHVTYEVAGRCHPERISAEHIADISEILTSQQARNNIIRSQANECLRQMFGELRAQSIANGYRIGELNERFKQALSVRLNFFGIEVFRTAIGGMRPPSSFQAGLIRTEVRRMETDIAINAVSRLAGIASSMSESDKAPGR